MWRLLSQQEFADLTERLLQLQAAGVAEGLPAPPPQPHVPSLLLWTRLLVQLQLAAPC